MQFLEYQIFVIFPFFFSLLTKFAFLFFLEIDKSNFITWYRANRKVLDPEMDELCHSTASFSGGLGTPVGGGAAVRRLSRSGGDRGGEQPLQQQRSRGAHGGGGERDSALGSDVSNKKIKIFKLWPYLKECPF